MQQMSKEVVDLYKHFEDLTQTKRQVDIMEREQKAKTLGPMMNQMIENRGGEYAFLKTGPEAQAVYANYMNELTGMGMDKATNLVDQVLQMDPSLADNMSIIRNEMANGSKPAMQMFGNLVNAAQYRSQAQKRGDPQALAQADALMGQIRENLEKLNYGTTVPDAENTRAKRTKEVSDREAEVRARAKTMAKGGTGSTQQEQPVAEGGTGEGLGGAIGRFSKSMQPAVGNVVGALNKIPEAPAYGIRAYGSLQENIGAGLGGPFGEALQQAGRDTQETAQGVIESEGPSQRSAVGGKSFQELQEMRSGRTPSPQSPQGEERGMWSQNVSTRQAFERAKENGEIPGEMGFNEYIVRSGMPQEIRSAPDYVQDPWVEKNQKLLEIKQKEADGEIAPEEAQSQRMKAASEVFQVQQAAETQLAVDTMQEGPAKSRAQEGVKTVANTSSQKEFLQELQKNPKTRPLVNDTLALIDSYSSVMSSVMRDQAQGRDISKKKLEIATKHMGGRLADATGGSLNGWYNNLISTGVINNPNAIRQMFPELAASAERVKNMELSERKVAVAEAEIGLQREQFLWQKGIQEQMMELERKASELKQENPQAMFAYELYQKMGPDVIQFMTTLAKEGAKPDEIREYVNSIPLLQAFNEAGVNQMAMLGVNLQAIDRELGIFQQVLSVFGKKYAPKYATPGFLGNTGGVNSPAVEEQGQAQGQAESGYNTGKWFQ